MKNILKKFKNIIISLLVVSMLITYSPAQATGIPVFDGGNFGQNIMNIIENTIGAVQQAYDTIQGYLEFDLSFVVSALKQEVLGELSSQVLSFSSGNSTEPKFVQDWGSFLEGSSLAGKAAYTDSVANSDICPSFKPQILNFLGHSGDSSSGGGNSNLDCSYNESSYRQSFTGGGGLSTYLQTLEPQNNFLGVYSSALNEQSQAGIKAEEAAKAEAIAGGGFLSVRDEDGIITTPGSLIQDLTSKAATVDFDLVVNAEQLEDIISNMGRSFIYQLTDNSSGGLTGSTTNRNRKTRNPDGSREELNCDNSPENLRDACLEAQESKQGSPGVLLETTANQLKEIINVRRSTDQQITQARKDEKDLVDRFKRIYRTGGRRRCYEGAVRLADPSSFDPTIPDPNTAYTYDIDGDSVRCTSSEEIEYHKTILASLTSLKMENLVELEKAIKFNKVLNRKTNAEDILALTEQFVTESRQFLTQPERDSNGELVPFGLDASGDPLTDSDGLIIPIPEDARNPVWNPAFDLEQAYIALDKSTDFLYLIQESSDNLAEPDPDEGGE
ncbi:MAG: hypothetical protein COU06_01165 [Candidatus Harrisonbacteria bacterium CG10_big_fil_rev_8_21_14_0_10_38_8]|uniref:Uncharacterized protein n=1 Tax=Candidatus Harrisonbacteria bacterium CG10_big_fil_rev_8_21_14_0_10_38_8 TaxID=1974582 RepID=A0A2M6WKA8_9BACT|nr:MAG: hypothetical protein COU06_01165 [Candidatus Harrisonbacteria bacterium CG10_big_fil_rev_8_21_14_0_10_38_8]